MVCQGDPGEAWDRGSLLVCGARPGVYEPIAVSRRVGCQGARKGIVRPKSSPQSRWAYALRSRVPKLSRCSSCLPTRWRVSSAGALRPSWPTRPSLRGRNDKNALGLPHYAQHKGIIGVHGREGSRPRGRVHAIASSRGIETMRGRGPVVLIAGATHLKIADRRLKDRVYLRVESPLKETSSWLQRKSVLVLLEVECSSSSVPPLIRHACSLVRKCM